MHRSVIQLLASRIYPDGVCFLFPAGPREHRFYPSGELHQFGGAPWAAAGPIQTGHAVSPRPEQWRGTGVLPGTHRAGEWKLTLCAWTSADSELSGRREIFYGLRLGHKVIHITQFCWISERLQNWSRKSYQALQWQKLTGPFCSLSCKKKKKGSISPVNVSVNPDTSQAAPSKL